MQLTINQTNKKVNFNLHIYNGIRIAIIDQDSIKDIILTEAQTKRLKEYLNELNL